MNQIETRQSYRLLAFANVVIVGILMCIFILSITSTPLKLAAIFVWLVFMVFAERISRLPEEKQ